MDDMKFTKGNFHEGILESVLDIGDSEVATTATYKGNDRWIVMVKVNGERVHVNKFGGYSDTLMASRDPKMAAQQVIGRMYEAEKFAIFSTITKGE